MDFRKKLPFKKKVKKVLADFCVRLYSDVLVEHGRSVSETFYRLQHFWYKVVITNDIKWWSAVVVTLKGAVSTAAV